MFRSYYNKVAEYLVNRKNQLFSHITNEKTGYDIKYKISYISIPPKMKYCHIYKKYVQALYEENYKTPMKEIKKN